MALLQIRDLCIDYRTTAGTARAVDKLSLDIEEGEYLGLVGESGCGKSTIAKAVLGILPRNGAVAEGDILFRGRSLPHSSLQELNRLRWRDIAMVPQSAMNGFDPVYTIEAQINEAIDTHVSWSREQKRKRIDELFAFVGLERGRAHDFPHQFSGGMRQRAMIAMAMALDPGFIVADEPTTGLDVIVQDQILHRIKEIHTRFGKTMLLITHDMAVVAENCDRIAVMYAGKLVEHGAHNVFETPFHPYTMGLCNAFPDLADRGRELISIPKAPPNLLTPPVGCRFADRCPFAAARCRAEAPALVEVGPGHVAACHFIDRAAEFRMKARDIGTWQGAAAAA
ncbi:ABC transporter ATP-binding protein [Roseomonas terrae]|uniref:ABC transporter ATP-binding protein n=1 Tax=Neoroseomonas terrae TaxID=424799 RepID=A0ABS5EC93_9PROT|nr:ABC transporter ATP-binding protein [Neoroseomonas terrae]MBR0648643.1 ABC transporter ATP-binding protein [Neoroseomonas terrae]